MNTAPRDERSLERRESFIADLARLAGRYESDLGKEVMRDIFGEAAKHYQGMIDRSKTKKSGAIAKYSDWVGQ